MATVLKPTEIWRNYSSNNAKKWLGFWTKWDSTTQKVIESYDSIRDIQLQDEGAKIRHQNTFIYSNGKQVNTGPMNGPWEYFRDRDCDDKGLLHPGYKAARAFFIENGGGTWTVKEPKRGEIFFLEIFFPRGDIRFSSGMMYNKNGEVVRTTIIREDARCRPSLFWSKDTTIRDALGFPIAGAFVGRERSLTGDLKHTVKEACYWDSTYWIPDENMNISQEKVNRVFYLPDNIAISFPVNLYTKGETGPFHISVCWFYQDNEFVEIREHTVYYDGGEFKEFKQGVYRPNGE